MNARRSKGLPLSFEVFAGNRADVTTVDEIVKSMEEKYGQAERVWVMDCGIVSELWRWCIQLTQAEAAFRTVKSDLKLRPIYHQKTERVEAHILVCFLALAQWRVLEQWMSSKGLGTCARKLITEISTIKSMDVIIPVKRGESSAELTVRTVARPERRVAELLTRLDLELPTRNRILGESKIDFKAKVPQNEV